MKLMPTAETSRGMHANSVCVNIDFGAQIELYIDALLRAFSTFLKCTSMYTLSSQSLDKSLV
jgi:hypothetical protein